MFLFRFIRRHPILCVLALLIAGGVVVGVRHARQPKMLPVKLVIVERLETLKALVRASGEIRAHQMVDIQTEVAGVIVELPVKEGQDVRKGEVLLRIDPFQTETELTGARARHAAAAADVKRAEAAIAAVQAGLLSDQEQIKVAEGDLVEAQLQFKRDQAALERQQKLIESKVVTIDVFETIEAAAKISERRVESARARLRRMQAQLKVSELTVQQQQAMKSAAVQSQAATSATLSRAQDQFKKVTLLSPLDGKVIQLNVDVGERAVPGILSNPQATLMTIANLATIEAEIEVDETDVVRLKLEQSATIDIDALPDDKLEGRITEIGSAPIRKANNQEGKDFEVIVAIAKPPAALRVGMSCEAEIAVETRTDVLGAPIQTLTTREVPVDENDNYLPPPKLAPEGKGKKEKGKSPSGSEKKVEGGDANHGKKEKQKKKELEGVFVMDADGFAHFRPVKTGIMGEIHVEILEGLEEGQEVISGPLKSLRELNEWTLVKKESEKK